MTVADENRALRRANEHWKETMSARDRTIEALQRRIRELEAGLLGCRQARSELEAELKMMKAWGDGWVMNYEKEKARVVKLTRHANDLHKAEGHCPVCDFNGRVEEEREAD